MLISRLTSITQEPLQSLFYEDLHFTSDARLLKLADSIIAYPDSSFIPFIRSITMPRHDRHLADNPERYRQYQEAIQILLSSVSRLRSTHISVEIPSSILVALVHHSRHTLRLLHLSCSQNISLRPLGHFSCLSDLSLTWFNWHSVPEWVLNLPAVTSFVLAWRVWEDTPDDLVEYLAKSRFHSSCRLMFQGIDMDTSQLQLLEPLFHSHKPESVEIQGMAGFHSILFLCTEDLTIDSVPPPGSFRGKVPARLTIITELAREMPALRAALDVLASRPTSGSITHHLQIVPDGAMGDWWDSDGPEHRQSLEDEMCEYGDRLARCGVLLLDD
jgi:hypothetical protein